MCTVRARVCVLRSYKQQKTLRFRTCMAISAAALARWSVSKFGTRFLLGEEFWSLIDELELSMGIPLGWTTDVVRLERERRSWIGEGDDMRLPVTTEGNAWALEEYN